MEFRTVRLKRNPECPDLWGQPTITGLIDYEQFCSGRSAADPKVKEEAMAGSISATELKRKVKERAKGDNCPTFAIRTSTTRTH
jgi:adenylyltransferase/sulfurtransferase